MPRPEKPEQSHIMDGPGHDHSTDCWCEPIYSLEYDEEHDKYILLVEHCERDPLLKAKWIDTLLHSF